MTVADCPPVQDDGSIEILLCDSQPLSRIGLKTTLSEYPGLRVVGETASGGQAVRAARALKPNVVLCDIGLTGLNVISFTERITCVDARVPAGGKTAIALIVDHVDYDILTALRLGASGILLKTCDVDELIWAIKAIHDGNRYLAPEVVSDVLDYTFGHAPTPVGNIALENLTPRELEVLELLATGMSNQEISDELNIGEPTVKYHMSQTLRKLDLRDRLQAVAFAYRNGLVSRGSAG
ncbi:LuxR C-terminal-related transcriptional regulator [Amycolatopsis sp. lyj-346]|uniref:LuxR C-terminal-related transcriptional regulator n=1 Tax=Amycolatopsis sp. lyj-346 TaxID=2789289 RepID=UPI00397A2E52